MKECVQCVIAVVGLLVAGCLLVGVALAVAVVATA